MDKKVFEVNFWNGSHAITYQRGYVLNHKMEKLGCINDNFFFFFSTFFHLYEHSRLLLSYPKPTVKQFFGISQNYVLFTQFFFIFTSKSSKGCKNTEKGDFSPHLESVTQKMLVKIFNM